MIGTENPMARPLLSGYRPEPGVRDEMADEGGGLRPCWQDVAGQFAGLGLGAIRQRIQLGRRLMEEGGIALGGSSGSERGPRPWILDPVPHVIAADEWAFLSGAVAQRARICDAVLADLYGPQRLLRQGLIPPDLVLGHRGFLRPCHGLTPAGGRFLPLYAVDVAKDAQGWWRVLADRTQAPSGMGYVLENRLMMQRMFPDIYRESSVAPVLPFFEQVRGMLDRLAPGDVANPRIVLLTPGPSNDRYFEHVHLARYLGVSLVEGGDLTVRDKTVFLRTLGGLQRVDVILRRLDDELCDPLELDEASLQGVPGLQQAVRHGSVAVANTLGSGLLDSPVFLPYLDRAGEYLLGENMALPAVETFLLDTERARDEVRANIGDYIFRTAFPSAGGRGDVVLGQDLSPSQQRNFLQQLATRGRNTLAQRIGVRATTPAWAPRGVRPRSFSIRLYAVATADGYEVLPGGRTLMGGPRNRAAVSIERSEASKDTWVLSPATPDEPLLLHRFSAPVPITRSGLDMPSRIADSLYWLGRYAERAEGALRALRALLQRLADATGAQRIPELPPLLGISVHLELLDATVLEASDPDAMHLLQSELLYDLFHDKCAGRLPSILAALEQTSWVVRDRLSPESLLALSHLAEEFPRDSRTSKFPLHDILARFDDGLLHLAGFAGLSMENNIRGPGWLFQDLGRRIERGLHLSALLRAFAAAPTNPEEEVYFLYALLQITGMKITYRSRYLSSVQPAAVLDLLLVDESCPRSIAFQLAAMLDHLHAFGDASRPASEESRAASDLLEELRGSNVHALCERDGEGERSRLMALLDRVDAVLPELSDVLANRFFSHSEAPRTMGAS